MRTFARVTLLALAAASLLALAAGSATALRGFSIRPGGPIIAEGPVRINEALRVVNIECELLLEGFLRPNVQKASVLPLGEMGQLRRLEFIGCLETLGRVPWIVRSLVEPGTPAPVLYTAFLGTLPLITGLLATTLNVGIRIMGGGTNCLFRGPLPYLIWKSPGEPLFNRKTFLPNRLTYVEGNCPLESWIEIEGTLIIRPGQMITLI